MHFFFVSSFFIFVVATVRSNVVTTRPVVSHPDVELQTLAFGSCHKNSRVSDTNTTIWDAIANVKPDAFLWVGDSIYAPRKGIIPLSALQTEYEIMQTNTSIGYESFVRTMSLKGGVHGTWDDHDYGGNDLGKEMPDKESRRDSYLDFLNVSKDSDRYQRQGVYSRVSFGTKISVLFLDTRWGREPHCIPSIATSVPFGSVLSCLTRWISAKLDLPNLFFPCRGRKVLNEEQWSWLERELQQLSDNDDDGAPEVYVVASSIQVLTTNPLVESWGHYPEERNRLLTLLNSVPGHVLLLSGDVHHAEITDVSSALGDSGGRQYMLEITSSGLTHSCTGPFYGRLCAPVLNRFSAHRFRGNNDECRQQSSSPFYYTGRNFGTIHFSWKNNNDNNTKDSNEGSTVTVNIHDHKGQVVLSTGERSIDGQAKLTQAELSQISKFADGHLRTDMVFFLLLVLMVAIIPFLFVLVLWFLLRRVIMFCVSTTFRAQESLNKKRS